MQASNAADVPLTPINEIYHPYPSWDVPDFYIFGK
jgi:hypothetical protein